MNLFELIAFAIAGLCLLGAMYVGQSFYPPGEGYAHEESAHKKRLVLICIGMLSLLTGVLEMMTK